MKANIFAPEGSSPQKAKISLSEEDKVQYDTDKKLNWRKKMGIPQEMYMIVNHRHSVSEDIMDTRSL